MASGWRRQGKSISESIQKDRSLADILTCSSSGNFGLQASRTVREYISVVLSHYICSNLLLKESYMAQNNLELKLPSRSSPPFYVKQRRGKKKDINVDCAQLPASPASGQYPEFLAPAV